MKCYVAFLKWLQNVLNSNINGKYALPVDRKDIKVLVMKSKNCQISQCNVFLKIKFADMLILLERVSYILLP